jgi:hypothetical protein
MLSKSLLRTDKKKTKLSWFEYILFYSIQQGWYNCYYSFRKWVNLIGNSYQGYSLLREDDDLVGGMIDDVEVKDDNRN